MPFKSDENMTFDTTTRAALDADEGDGQLLIGFGDSSAPAKVSTKPSEPASGGLLDMDLMLGSSDPAPVPVANNNLGDMMDLFGDVPSAATTAVPT